MVTWRSARNRSTLLALVFALVAPLASYGQFDFGGGGLGGLLGGDEENPVTVTAQFTPAIGDQPAVLIITADIAPGWHVYSLTQPKGGPLRTQIKLEDSPQYRVLGSFAAMPEPMSRIDQTVWTGVEIQEHAEQVTWYVPIELAAGVDPAQLTIDGLVDLQACKESCIPLELPFAAKLGKGVPIGPLSMEAPGETTAIQDEAPPLEGPVSIGTYRAKDSEVTWEGWLKPAQITPGGTATLHLQAEPSADWHIYARAENDSQVGSKPTLIAITHPAGLEVFQPQTTAEIIAEDRTDIGFGIVRHHAGTVTWTIPIQIPDNAPPSKRTLGGVLGYQACESREDGLGSCEIAKGVQFQVSVEIVATADPSSATAQPVNFAAANYSDAATAAGGTKPAPKTSPEPAREMTLTAGPAYELSKVTLQGGHNSLLLYLALAFAGGLVLNLMPCVLPVIGLKVMSFVDQAGHSRSKALTLNLWYAAGIVSVFLVLASIAATSSTYSWGEQSSSTMFNVFLVALVFAMALSLLGVWEIPIPGFIGSGSVHEVASKEGVFGAFLKGIVTTILAIPCTGPFMATAVGWAVNQPAATTFQVFAVMGLGMASPYLVVGVFPQLLRFLPKPGMWMETFKQVMGFVLLGTVVFIMTYMDSAALVPTVALLAGIGLACWVYSRTPATAEFNDRLQTWALSGAIATGSALFAFGYLYQQVMLPRFEERIETLASTTANQKLQGLLTELRDVTDPAQIAQAIKRVESTVAAENQGPWQPFTLHKLGQVTIEEGRTVLVDFSAEWCLNCKVLEKAVLHTEPVDQAIAAGNVVTMYADFTDKPPELAHTIRALGGSGVPVIAVFPGNDPYRPIVFRGAYTQGDIVAALEKATGRKLEAGAEVLQASAGSVVGQ